MPELPEVETMRRGIAAVCGCRILAVEKPPCPRRPIVIEPGLATLRRRMIGRRIAATARLGKRVILVLDSQDRLIIEPRMTGLVLLAAPPTVEHLRLRLRLASAAGEPLELLFWDRRGLGQVRLLNPEEYARRLESGQIGPDALEIAADALRAQLEHSRRPIKVALLDQKALAGVGNLYASEILHVAGISPLLPCTQLKPRQWRRLHASLQHVLCEAVRYEGSTLADGTYRNALNQSGGYQNHHRVYERAGQTCLGCGKGEILRVVQAQRSTFYCPKCQR